MEIVSLNETKNVMMEISSTEMGVIVRVYLSQSQCVGIEQ